MIPLGVLDADDRDENEDEDEEKMRLKMKMKMTMKVGVDDLLRFYDESYPVMKSCDSPRSDNLWRFACGDVLIFPQKW